MESHDTRLPYLSSSHERVSQDVPSTTSLEPPRTSDPPHHYPYVPSQGHPPSSPMYPAAGQSSWGERGTTGRVVQSDWLSDQNERPPSSMSTSKSHPQSWPDTTPSISITTNTSTPSHSPNFQFPTLNSPFYPNQPQRQANYQNRSSASSTPSHPSPNPASHYDSVHGEVTGSSQTGRHASYDPHSYARSAPINPLNGYTPGHGAHIYQSQSQSQHSRPIGLSHLAPIPSISTFSHAQAMHPPSTSVGPTGYWPRENMESQ